MRKLEIMNAENRFEAIYRRVDARRAKYGELSETEIDQIVQKHRHSKT